MEAPAAKAQVNFTEPELSIMKTANKGWDCCGNAQAGVDDGCQIILACEVTAECNDQRQGEPMARATREQLDRAGIGLAANLTTQVRAIAEVATAVTQGDLTRSIALAARGEMAALKDNINEMIHNLRETTRKNTEQDWLKTNLTRFTRLLQGQKDLMAVARLILSELAPVTSAQHGAFYLLDSEGEAPVLKLLSSYAFQKRKHLANRFNPGEGLVGQSVLEKQRYPRERSPR